MVVGSWTWSAATRFRMAPRPKARAGSGFGGPAARASEFQRFAGSRWLPPEMHDFTEARKDQDRSIRNKRLRQLLSRRDAQRCYGPIWSKICRDGGLIWHAIRRCQQGPGQFSASRPNHSCLEHEDHTRRPRLAGIFHGTNFRFVQPDVLCSGVSHS